jgi:hypothetical protein
LRDPDYYPEWVNGVGRPHRRDLIRQIREGDKKLYDKFIERYVMQCEASFDVKELTPDVHLLWEMDKEDREDSDDPEIRFVVVINDWACGMIEEWQEAFHLPTTYLSGHPIRDAKDMKELISILQQIGKEYPHWMMEMMYIVLRYGDFARCRPPRRNYALTKWEAKSTWEYLSEVEKLPDPVYGFPMPLGYSSKKA